MLLKQNIMCLYDKPEYTPSLEPGVKAAYVGLYSRVYCRLGQSIHSFILAISVAPLQALCYSYSLPNTPQILYRSFTPKRKRDVYVCMSAFACIHASIHPSTHTSIPPFIYPSIHPSIHTYIHH